MCKSIQNFVNRYILAQLIGAFIACLIVYLQWKGPITVSLEVSIIVPLLNLLQAAEAALAAKGTLDEVQFTPLGPAGIFGFYAPPGAYIGYVFANEFFVVCRCAILTPCIHI